MNQELEQIFRKLAPIRNQIVHNQYTEEEYRQLVGTMGVNEWEWQRAMDSFGDFLTRAQGYIKHALPQEALSELDYAQLLKPDSLDVHLALSQAHLQLFNKNKALEHQQKAKLHAQKCLMIEPEFSPALKIISDLNKKSASNYFKSTGSTTNSNNASKMLPLVIGIAVLLAGIAGVAVFVMVGNENKSYDEGMGLLQTEEMAAEAIINDPMEKEGRMLEIILAEVGLAKGFDIEVLSARIEKESYKVGFVFHIRGYVTSEDYELQRMEIVYELCNDKGQVISSGKFHPKAFGDEAQSGEKNHFFGIELGDSPADEITKVKLKVVDVDKKAAKASYPEAELIDVKWGIRKTRDVNLQLYLRQDEIKYNQYGKKVYHTGVWEIENLGEGIITELNVKVSYYDENDNFLGADNEDLIRSSDFFLYPQDRYPKKFILTAPATANKIARYEVEFTDAKVE